MLFASRSKFDAETAVRQLRDDVESRVNNLRTEWMQYLVAIEDVQDKIDHLVKRNRKRDLRENLPVDSVPEAPQLDLISQRVNERRQSRGISA